MMVKTIFRTLTLGALVVASSMVKARQMLYFYDFETVSDAGIYAKGMNKGTGSLELQRKGGYANWMSGALGSGHGFHSRNLGDALWLGDVGKSIGCSGLSGFTLSFWVNAPETRTAWSDFFGIRFGEQNLRFEYLNTANPDFRIYGASCILSETDAQGDLKGILSAGSWTHFCLVWNFNRVGIDLYVSGALCASITNAAWDCGKTLQQIQLGSYVREIDGRDRQTTAKTGLDDFALFDFSATPEQVQWLAHHSPALPPNGPGRDMPYRFSCDRVGEGGILLESYGSAQTAVSQLGSGYRNYTTGAFGSGYAYDLKVNALCNSLSVSSSDPHGLGASIDTGFTFSIWVKGLKPASAWSDFLGFSVGNKTFRSEWVTKDSPTASGYGHGSQSDNVLLETDVWNNLCYVWNSASGLIDIYLNGNLAAHWNYTDMPSPEDVLTRFEIGSVVPSIDGSLRRVNSKDGPGTPVDEAALFNYSFSADEIREMIQAPPLLPSFTMTNLVRTIDSDGAWQGFAARWTVNATAQRLTWPAWEDIRVDAAVTVAGANLTFTNDSFVTCRSLAFTNGTEAPTVRLAVPNTSGAQFKPQALTLGDGVELVLPFGDCCAGTVTLGENAKLVFDAAVYEGVATVFTAAGGFTLPEGETDVLAHTALVNGGADLELVFSSDGKEIRIRPVDTVPATAVWKSDAADRDLMKATNWVCKNAAGDVLEEVIPTARTVVEIYGTTSLSVPPESGFVCARVTLDSVTLTDDCDWRGLGALVIPHGVTVDVNGHTLTLVGLDGSGTICDNSPADLTTTDSSSAGSLCLDIPEGVIVENHNVTFAGNLQLVKKGAGTFVASKVDQTYFGGTQVSEGLLTDGNSTPPNTPFGGESEVTIEPDGVLELNGLGGLGSYLFVLNGGILQNTTVDEAENRAQIVSVRLKAPSTFKITSIYGFVGPGYAATTLDLGGHTLTVPIGDDKKFYLFNTTMTAGTLDISGDGWLVVDKTAFNASAADLRVNCALDIRVPSTVGSYEALYAGDKDAGAQPFTVTGTFKPHGSRYHGVILADGAMLDLSECTTALNVVSTFAGQQLTFAPDATVTLDLGDRWVPGGSKVVEWDEDEKPEKLQPQQFKVKANGRKYYVAFGDDGIYLKSGLAIYVR